ncbi:MAG TPA: hypothetical protein PKZ99_09890 [Azospirillaceae bacterium]|nr:hypothetical protein [Azospirillaceae bacterium]
MSEAIADLFEGPGYHGGRRRNTPSAAHFKDPGSGPMGQTCGGCWHLNKVGHHGKSYHKCGLVRWTHGAATDIRLKDPACSGWEAKT